jgi:small subunit ribosomal protein S18
LSLARQALPVKKDLGREMQEFSREQDFTKHMYRRWRPGDVYAPHDLSGAEQKKWKTGQTRPQSDAFDVLGINPINEYKVSLASGKGRRSGLTLLHRTTP